MDEDHNVVYRTLSLEDLVPSFLDGFDRYQETHRVWVREGDGHRVRPDHFVEDWDAKERARVIRSLRNCFTAGGAAVGAFLSSELVGFASVEGERFGPQDEYVELSHMHVSRGHRGHGVGRGLFDACCERARALGASKLYIGAHPSESTQEFYRSRDCSFTQYINQRINSREPGDLQLEFTLHTDI